MHGNVKNLVGKRFGRLQAVKYKGSDKKSHSLFECKCDCGNLATVLGVLLTNGGTKSCGCLRREISKHASDSTATHRMTKTPEFVAWRNMKNRCYNSNSKDFNHYGGRGIKVCDEWLHDFCKFYEYVGPRPSSKHSLDRIKVNGNYEPGNVRWATQKQQIHNRRKYAALPMFSDDEIRQEVLRRKLII